MHFRVELSSRSLRAVTLSVAVCAVLAFVGLATTQFIVAVMADPKIPVEPAALRAAADYFPNSAPVQARIAARIIESKIDAALTHEDESALAVRYATRAVNLSPWNYEHWMLLAAAREWQGDAAQAETELRQAIALAPHHVEANWRLANLLVRQGKLQDSLEKFNVAIVADPRRLNTALSLLWQASDGNQDLIHSLVGNNPKAQMSLAKFLADQGKAEDALSVVSRLDGKTLLDSPESSQMLNAMLSANLMKPAKRFWQALFGNIPDLIWNGSFETPLREDLTQFDWNLKQSKYALIGITTNQARTGQRALKIVYYGLDTTRLDGEIRQLIPVDAGGRYRLIFHVRALNFVTPDAPQLVVTSADAKTTLGGSVIPAGSYDWRQSSIDFTVPAETQAIAVTIRQTPKFSFVDATEGTVWMDDFVMIRQ